ncbi:MAG: hypothetical protein JW903_08160 [Clostridia bacterium]|nr:hypothetical protein [Clostridia bacterium]
MKKIFVTLLAAALLMAIGTVAIADADRQFSEDISYFGAGLSDSIATAYSSISAGSSTVSLSCYTGAVEIYDVMLYEMELQKLVNGQWSRVCIFYDTMFNTSSISGSEIVSVTSGTYRVHTYHYIQWGLYEDDTYTTSQSVTVP